MAFHVGKAVVQVAAVQVPVDDLPEIGTEESVRPPEPLFVSPDEGFKMILNASIIIGCPRISRPIYGGLGSHDSSPPRKTGLSAYTPYSTRGVFVIR
jgi:hypothetical protein